MPITHELASLSLSLCSFFIRDLTSETADEVPGRSSSSGAIYTTFIAGINHSYAIRAASPPDDLLISDGRAPLYNCAAGCVRCTVDQFSFSTRLILFALSKAHVYTYMRVCLYMYVYITARSRWKFT